MTELKIKYIFLGNKPIKEPNLINNTLCIYLNSGKHFSFARTNQNIFEYFLKSNYSKKTINLLSNSIFYDFIAKIPNINNYAKITETKKFEKFNNFDKVIKAFEMKNLTDAERIIKHEIKEKYLNYLKKKYQISNLIEKKADLKILKKRKAIRIKPKVKLRVSI